MIHLAEPNLNGNERKYLNACIDSTFVSSVGKFVTDLEKSVSRASGAKYCTAVSSGTAGLHMALRACGVQPGDLVCIPDFTFIATANAVAHCHAEPWLIDVSRETWTMDCDCLENCLEKNTVMRDGRLIHKLTGQRIAAIMPVYTLGLPADMNRINKIARCYGIPVVADAAAAIGASYKGQNIGGLADATIFSFNGNKTITCGGGGAVVSDRKEIVELASHLSTTARCGTDYDHDMIGYNNRMTNLQAAVGCAQLERLEELVGRKRYIQKFYKEKLSHINKITFFPECNYAEGSCWFSGIVIPRNCEIRILIGELRKKNIEARTFWKPLHLQRPYKGALKSEIKASEDIWGRILTLPSSTGITEGELNYVAETLELLLQG